MKVKNLRWGYDGGGFAGGPVEGSTMVEIFVTANDMQEYHIVASRYTEFEKIIVSDISFFDDLLSNDYPVERIEESSIEVYDYEITDIPEEMEKSEFAKAIQLARLAMEEYYGYEDTKEDVERAQQFIEPYLEKDLENFELPEIVYEDFI